MAAKAKLIEIREDEQQIIKICENAQVRLKNEDQIDASYAPGIATVAYVCLREAINHISANKSVDASEVELDFAGILTLGISYRENDEAEKEGNFTPYVTPGRDFELLVKEGKVVEKSPYSKDLTKVAEVAGKVLKNDRGIDIDKPAVILDMARAFFVEAALYLYENRSTEEAIELNAMQLIDMGVEYQSAEEGEEEGAYVPFARPGQEFKLLVKDDDTTEE